ncbi:MAG: hypothetical protein ACREN8_11600, partial [Candidatus Dormibacteraceae bacterium]
LQVHEGDRSPGSGSWMGSPDPQKLVSATCELDTTDQHTAAGWVDKSGNLIDPSQVIAPPGTADGPFLPLPICHTLDAAAQPGIQWAIDQEAVVAQHLQGGSIDAHPKLDNQLCNLQTLFFIKGAGVNGDEKTDLRQSINLAGYTFLFTTQLASTDWDYGDHGRETISGSGGLGNDQLPPKGVSTVKHPYDKIGEYRVKAAEKWVVTAMMIDPAGHTTSIPQASKEFHQAVTTTGQVGQLEGVPVNG